MSQECPLCKAQVSLDRTVCPDCGSQLDPYGTIGIPGKANALARARTPDPSVGPAPSRPEEEPPPPPRRPKPQPEMLEPAPEAPPRPRSNKPKAKSSTASPRATPPAPAQPSPPPPAPYPTPGSWQPPAAPGYPAPGYAPPPAPAYPPQPAPAYAQPPAPQARPGFFRRLFGGTAPAPEPQYMPPSPSPSQRAPDPGYPQQPGYPAQPWAQPPQPAPYGQPPPGPAGYRPAPPDVDRDDMTVGMQGVDVSKFKFPSTSFSVQLLDNNGQWRTWTLINPGGLNIGRSQGVGNIPFLNSMAPRHLRLSYEAQRLHAEDLGSLNGVYIKITEPVELTDGSRFRLGSQVLEFHRADRLPAIDALSSPDGEEFLSCDPEVLAQLDLIRANNEVGFRFPITSPGITRIGRDVDMQFTLRAEWVSGKHAQVRHDQGRFWLEDTGSRNGTFLQIRGKVPLKNGDILLVGRALLRVVAQGTPGS